MPRPKRPKVVHTVPTLRGEKLITTTTAQPHLGNVSPASSGRVTNATDDSDGLVTTQKLPAGAKRPVAREEYTMTGALGDEEPTGTRLRPPSKRVVEEANRIAREAKYASIAADRRRAREDDAITSTGQIQVQQSLQSGGGPRPEKTTALSITQSRRPSILSKDQQTPLAHSSTLGAALFKKRPRQPSLLQMVQSQNVQSELHDDDDESLYDFRPDDESTPLVKSQNPIPAVASSSSRQTSGSRKRKLATPEIQVPASQSDIMRSSPSTVLSQPLAQEGLRLLEDAPSPETVLPQLPLSQTPAPEIFSDTLAPPQSSSSPPPARSKRPTRKPSAQPVPSSKAQKLQQINSTAPSRTSHTTTSTTSSSVRQPLRPLPTAALQNLLPRRKTRQRPPRGAFDFPSSSEVELDTSILSEHEDELSFNATRKARRKTNTKTPARNMQPSTKKSTTKTKGRTKETPIVVTSKGSKRVSKTYTRQSIVDGDATGVSGDEDADEDDSLGPASLKKHSKGKGDVEFDKKAKKEMERMARKFAEVDDYALDFEDMTGSSSQMADAR